MRTFPIALETAERKREQLSDAVQRDACEGLPDRLVGAVLRGVMSPLEAHSLVRQARSLLAREIPRQWPSTAATSPAGSPDEAVTTSPSGAIGVRCHG